MPVQVEDETGERRALVVVLPGGVRVEERELRMQLP